MDKKAILDLLRCRHSETPQTPNVMVKREMVKTPKMIISGVKCSLDCFIVI
jgi:hypothetical protein